MEAVEIENSGEKRTLTVSELKLKALKRALILHDGNIAAAADEIGVGRDTVYRWLKKDKRLKRLVSEIRANRGIDPDEQ